MTLRALGLGVHFHRFCSSRGSVVPDRVQLAEDFVQVRVALHLVLDAFSFRLALSRSQERAVEDHLTILLEQLDKVEAVEAEEDHQLILALSFVRHVAQDVENFAGPRLGHHRVAVELGQLSLEPVGVNVQRMKLLLLLAAQVDASGGGIGVNCPVIRLSAFFSLLIVLFIPQLAVQVLFLLVFVGIFKLNVDAVLVVHLLVTLAGALFILSPVCDLLAQVYEESKALLRQGAQQLLSLLLLLLVLELVILQDGEDLISSSTEDIPGLIAECLLDKAEQNFICLLCVLCLGSVDDASHIIQVVGL